MKTQIVAFREMKHKTSRYRDFVESVAEDILKLGPEDVISKKQIAQIMRKHRARIFKDKNYNPTEDQLASTVFKVRYLLESEHKTTLLSVRGLGYKNATPKEATDWAVRSSGSLKQGERCQLRQDIVDPKHLKTSIEQAFKHDRNALDNLINNNRLLEELSNGNK